MIAVRPSNAKIKDGRRKIELIHYRAEMLTEAERKEMVEVKEIPEAISDDRYRRILVLNEDNTVGVYEERKPDSGKTVLTRLIKEGRMTVDEIEDEELRKEIEKDLETKS